MRILFHARHISERGTEVALFDYAEGNETQLGWRSYIAAPADRVLDITVLEKFAARFEICIYHTMQELEEFIEEKGIGLVYRICSGEKEEPLTEKAPEFIHCVFYTRSPFGSVYVPISGYLNRYYRTSFPVLPHIVKPFPGGTGTMHEELGIPEGSKVFGGYGGREQFDIGFVRQVVEDVAAARPDLYFLFMNFEPFGKSRPNLIFLPKNTSVHQKERFINTCTAMLHGRSDGETFGLAVAEFSVKNRPVITWKPDFLHNSGFIAKSTVRRWVGRKHLYAEAHLDFLGKKAVTYGNYHGLRRILEGFGNIHDPSADYDCYSKRFTPEKVMHIFRKILLDYNLV